VGNLGDYTPYRGGIFALDHLVKLSEAQAANDSFLMFGATDTAANILDA
jgi:hypothetical protein